MREAHSLTDYVAGFISGTSPNDIPMEVVQRGKRSILDGVGLAVAGSRSHASKIARQYLAKYDCGGNSTFLGTPHRGSARSAAFVNGLAIHADDFDDTQLARTKTRVYGLLTHPTAPVLPSALAIAERDGLGGRELLCAYLVGVEVETKVAEAINPRHYVDGFHSTGTIGTIGSAAAVANLLSLSEDETSVALSLAASQAAGLRENFGTMTKPFHAGRAAESGLIAAELAQAGFSAASHILEAQRGFFQAAGSGYDADLIDAQLGRPWTFDDPGISIKPHPSGSLTHPGMGALLDLIHEHRVDPASVERVTVWTSRHMPNALIHHRPATELEAKFSMEFCLAILLLRQRAGLAEFTDEVVQQPDVQSMIKRVVFEAHPEAEVDGYNKMTTLIQVELRNGEVLKTRADYGKGSPQLPMSDSDLTRKFVDCLAWAGFSKSDARSIAPEILSLEHVSDVRTLTDRLRADARE